MKYLSLSVAALAMAAAGGLSAQGNGNGKGNGPDKERGGPAQAHEAERGNDKARANGKANRDDSRADNRQVQRANNGSGNSNANRGSGNAKAERGNSDVNRGNGNVRVDRRVERRVERDVDRRGNRLDDRVIYRDRGDGVRILAGDYPRRLVEGCPPGLAKKNPPCVPPGQAKQRDDFFGTSYRPSLFGLSGYGDGRYYYDDGYLMRLGDGGRIGGYIPLLGGALSIGNPWPSNYNSYSVPDYYADYYNLGDRNRYRYADNVLYRVDPETSVIQSIAALLTGDEFAIGQPAPSGYQVYNVPYSSRDRYYDTPDAHYRYSDGYVYRIDPETQLVAAAIDLLV
ncbi:MAG: hypothetical protein ACR2FJ_02575 [Qipengyuania sp.]